MAKTLIFGHFEPKKSKIAKMRFFSEKTAVYVSCPYSDEHSCAKAKRSLEPFFRKTVNQLPTTNGSGSIGPGD